MKIATLGKSIELVDLLYIRLISFYQIFNVLQIITVTQSTTAIISKRNHFILRFPTTETRYLQFAGSVYPTFLINGRSRTGSRLVSITGSEQQSNAHMLAKLHQSTLFLVLFRSRLQPLPPLHIFGEKYISKFSLDTVQLLKKN